MVSNRRVAEFFYTKSAYSLNIQICNICNERKKATEKGFTNLKSHIYNKHPQQYPTFIAEVKSGQGGSFEYAFQLKTRKISAWLEVITMSLLPFSAVQKTYTRTHFNTENILYDNFMKYMRKMTK